MRAALAVGIVLTAALTALAFVLILAPLVLTGALLLRALTPRGRQ